MESHQESNSRLWKWMGTLFAAIIAPVIAGVAVNLVQRVIEKADEKAEAKTVAKADPSSADQEKNKPPAAEIKKDQTKTSKDSGSDQAQAKDQVKTKDGDSTKTTKPETPLEPRPTSPPSPLLANASKPVITPTKKRMFALRPIRLFNGNDLTNFYTWMFSGAAGRPPAKNRDTDKIFSVRGGELRLSGAHPGALITEDLYSNYHLTVAYRWGETPAPPHRRTAGIVMHFPKDTPEGLHVSPGFRCQIAEDGTGNLAILAGPDDKLGLTAPAHAVSISLPRKSVTRKKQVIVKKEPAIRYAFRPVAPLATERSGILYRFGYFINSTADEYRPGTQFENEIGSLNRLDLFCVNDQIAVFLNDQLVNFAVIDPGPQQGRIAIICENAEVFIKQVMLRHFNRALPVPKVLSQKKPADL